LILRTPFPIPFVSKVKKVDKVDGPDTEKIVMIKLEFLMDLNNPVLRFQKLLTCCYIQGWIPRGVDKM
jgi:hypothetical protein